VTGLVLYNQWKQQYPGASGYTYPAIPRGYVGLVGRLTYDYQSRYLFDINVGYNGSENFAPKKRYGLFPAVSAGWVISEEKWMKGQNVIDFLKIRGSVGLVGNDLVNGKERFYYLPSEYNPNASGYNFGTGITTLLPTAVEKKIGNEGVTWEKSLKYTVGLDFKMLRSRFSGSLDLFMENRWDILTTVNTTPAFIAVDLPVVNLGKVKNRGFEVELGWKDKIGSKFGYRIKGNLSYAHNTIIEMDEVPKEYPWQVETGRSVGQNFGYVFDGFVTEEDIASGKLPNQHTDLHPGDAKYVDLNNDGEITTVDQKAIGYPKYPELTGGLTLGFDFFGFDFSMLWSGAAMVSRYINTALRIPFGPTQLLPLQRWIYDGRWTEETASTATLPRVSTNSITNNYTLDSSLWLRNAAYLRLKNVRLGYSFPSAMLKKVRIRGLRLYVAAENVLTIDSYKISDPENTDRSYPLQTTFTAGVNLTF
jgi:TonB-linked SusC/RagA family outer membrane protein